MWCPVSVVVLDLSIPDLCLLTYFAKSVADEADENQDILTHATILNFRKAVTKS